MIVKLFVGLSFFFMIGLGLVRPTLAMKMPVVDVARSKSELIKEEVIGEIKRRLVVFSNALERVEEMKVYGDDQKRVLAGTVRQEIDNLNTLKEKASAEIDLEMLNEDKQMVESTYASFVFLVPQTTIVTHADRVLVIVGQVRSYVEAVEVRTSEMKLAGKNVVGIENKIDDLSGRLDKIESEAWSAIDAVSGFGKDDYLSGKSGLTGAAMILKGARYDLKTVGGLVVDIRKMMKDVK